LEPNVTGRFGEVLEHGPVIGHKHRTLLNTMAEPQHRNYWFLYSIADIIFIAFFLGILAANLDLFAGADAGFHIKVGDYILDHRAVPTHDIFPSATPPSPWTPPQWLAEVIFAILHRAFGLTGVAVFMVFVMAALCPVLFKFLRSSGVSIVVAAMTVAIAAGTSGVHWLARPHVFALILLLVWYIVLDAFQYRRKSYLYLLPLVMLLWANIHGSFVIGFVLLFVYIAGNVFKARSAAEDSREASKRVRVLAFFFVLSLVATLANPQGYKILLSPFELASNRVLVDRISEWRSPNFHGILLYEYMLLFMIVVFATAVKRLNAIEVMLVLIFTHMSLYSGRFIPLYAVIVSPIIAKQIDKILEEHREKKRFSGFIAMSGRITAIDARTKWHLWSALAILAAVVMCFTGTIKYDFDRKSLPVDAVEFLQQEKITGNVFNSDVFGSYMIYAAVPGIRMFYDGRDMFGKERTEEYLKVMDVEMGWDDVLTKYDISCVIYGNHSALSSLLLEREDWQLVYSDKVANVFVKKTPENQALIAKYPNVRPAATAKDEGDRK